MTNPINFVKDLLHGFEPVVLVNLVAGAAAAIAAAAGEVEPTEEQTAVVAAVWVILTFLQRQLVRPEKRSKDQDEYTLDLESRVEVLMEHDDENADAPLDYLVSVGDEDLADIEADRLDDQH